MSVLQETFENDKKKQKTLILAFEANSAALSREGVSLLRVVVHDFLRFLKNRFLAKIY